MTGADLARAVLEGEDPKQFLRSISAAKTAQLRQLDTFIQAYLVAALWSTSLPPYGLCPICGEEAVLDRWDEQRDYVCRQCSDREPNDEPPADLNYDIDDLSPETLEASKTDCLAFAQEHYDDISSDLERAGHDFWLTRNGHGAGFWDGDWPEEAGKRLTDASHAYGSVNLYVGDDGKIYGT